MSSLDKHIAKLGNINKYDYPDLEPLEQDWRWCHKYAHNVLTGKIPACNKMKWAALRHFRDLLRDDLYFDIEGAKSIVLWFNFIPLTDGKDAGSPTILDPSQIFIACSLIGWKWGTDTWDEDGNPLTIYGERRFTQAYMLVSRKWGKTTFAAGIKLYLMYKHGHQPRCFSLATKKDQAKIVWTTACEMIRLSPRLRKIFLPRANDILIPNKSGVFKALASDSNSLDGLNPMAAVLDECHAVKDRNLYGVIISAFGAQTEFLMSVITTAGFILDGLCTDLYKNGARVLDPDQDIEQDNYFYAIFEIDEKDDWTDHQNWYKSNPSLVYGRPSMKYLRDRFKEAQMSVDEKANFITKHCNRFVSGSDKWLDIDQFRKGARDINFDDFRDRECWVGFDRSMISDITSATVTFADDDGGITEFVFNIQSRGAIDKAGDYLRSIYHKAEETDDLRVVPGEYIRDSHIKELIRWLWEQLPKCRGVYYDPYKMKGVALDLEEEGIEMISVSMGPGNVSEPAKKVESLIADELFRYKNSVLLEYAVMCALVDVSKYGNMMVYRDKLGIKTDRIDPLIATILGISGATLIKNAENVYESRGLLSI